MITSCDHTEGDEGACYDCCVTQIIAIKGTDSAVAKFFSGVTLDSALEGIPNYGADHPTYWGAALSGEAGELANITKKWERDGLFNTVMSLIIKGEVKPHLIEWYGINDRVRKIFTMIRQNVIENFDEIEKSELSLPILKAVLGDELADVVIYCHLAAEEWGIDLAQAVEIKKRANAKKDRVG